MEKFRIYTIVKATIENPTTTTYKVCQTEYDERKANYMVNSLNRLLEVRGEIYSTYFVYSEEI